MKLGLHYWIIPNQSTKNKRRLSFCIEIYLPINVNKITLICVYGTPNSLMYLYVDQINIVTKKKTSFLNFNLNLLMFKGECKD